MKNVQITVDQETLARVDRFAKPLGLKRSEIMRRALRDWLDRQSVEAFEREWIESIQENGDSDSRAETWKDAQAWSEPRSKLRSKK